jgi:hypothetical protein
MATSLTPRLSHARRWWTCISPASAAPAGRAPRVDLRVDLRAERLPQTAYLCDGEGQNRTGDTTIFSQGNRSHDLAMAAGAFLNGGTQDLPLVSCGFLWIAVMRPTS